MGLLAKFLGAMVGSALGDAIGELAFRDGDSARLNAHIDCLDTLLYTDDTAMAIALAESLIAVGDVDAQQVGDRFRAQFECVYCAILHGGDRDTVGAMAGGLSGALLGIDAITPQWRDKLENRTRIEWLARRLAAVAERRMPGC
ncbi:MAG: hypothetical protein BMS9Abin10_0970 [Gammaproteobacteria bacterium]|nr:MAG: hypothetical protein BMS9Abin10_0970 [Gammaproteobacteria bacterium]